MEKDTDFAKLLLPCEVCLHFELTDCVVNDTQAQSYGVQLHYAVMRGQPIPPDGRTRNSSCVESAGLAENGMNSRC